MSCRALIPAWGLLCLFGPFVLAQPGPLESAHALCAASTEAQAPVRSPGPPQQKLLRLAPRFPPGQTLRYQMEFRTITEGRSEGPIEDPQAPSQLELSVAAVVRLEVLGVEPVHPERLGVPACPGQLGCLSERIRMRTTYEKSEATSRSDSFDPEAGALEAQYRNLQGRSIQFTVGADGQVSEIEGLKEILPDEKAAHAAREWLAQLTLPAALPQRGIVMGQKWSSEQPLTTMPLVGMVWRTESTYLRNELCRSPALAEAARTGQSAAGETCAVILARFEMAQPHAPRDPTPEEYRKRGLRTAGKWSGSGESLSYVSLRTGLLVSVTQMGLEELDLTVATADGESRVRYTGRIRSQLQISLLPEAPPR